ncbi:MAG TPA: hypothetical protein VGK34_08700, partial [Armatimonadota bacterium]
TAVKSKMTVNSLSSASGGWNLTLKAKNGSALGTATLGVDPASAERIDSPYGVEDYVDVAFGDGKGAHFVRDIRRTVAAKDSWAFTVSSDNACEIELSWMGTGTMPSQSRLSLVDDATNKSVTMPATGSYVFHLDEGQLQRSFHIVVD